jgi:type IV secretory pathway protease TraF
MNTKYLKTAAKAAVLVIILSYGVNLRAATPSTPQTLSGSVVVQNQYQTVAFSDTAEAGMLRNAYFILATGDHDYKGHRVRAMHQVEVAGKLLGMDLRGDVKDRQPQPLSDAKMREAQGLLQNVLGAAEVKSQERITRHITDAINQINVALSVH